MFSTKVCLSGPMKRNKLTVEVHKRASSHLATIIFCALQPQDGSIFRPEDGKLEIFLTSNIDFLFIFG